jgi:hypothetical protein
MGEKRRVTCDQSIRKKTVRGKDDRLNQISLSNLATVVAAFSELRQLQYVESAVRIEGVDAIVLRLRRVGKDRNSALLIGVAEAIEDELINGATDA